MTALLHNKDICVDATHPYAVEAGRNILKACENSKVRYVRLLRESLSGPFRYEKAVYVKDAVTAAREALKEDGNILLATGVKDTLR